MKTCSVCGAEKSDDQFREKRLQCKQCRLSKAREKPEALAANHKRWYEKHKPAILEARRLKSRGLYQKLPQERKDQINALKRARMASDQEARKKNQAGNKARHAVNMLDPKYRKRMSDKSQEWIYANYDKHLARVKSRDAALKGHKPAWADESVMRSLYRLAQIYSRALGEPYQVDHIVPLKSKLVCGFHVQHNLQILPASANARKGNRHWPDTF